MSDECELLVDRVPCDIDFEGVDSDDEVGLVLLDDQDRSLWSRPMISEGLALIDKALRHRTPGPYQIQSAIAALHARADRPAETDWAQIELLYAALERLQPSPVITRTTSERAHPYGQAGTRW